MRKTVTAAAMAASLTVGGVAGATLFVPTLSGAQSGGSATEETTEGARGDGFLAGALAPLVDDGTITEDQADAVIAAIRDARPADRFLDHHLPFGSALLDVLGIDAAELRAALEDGQTIAEIARANDVPVDEVVDALAAEARERLDEAVTDGRLTREEADERLAGLTDRLTAMVNGEAPLRGRHHEVHRGPFGFDRGDDTSGS